MKKIFFALLILASSILVLPAQEKPKSKSDQRKAKREQRKNAEKEAQQRYTDQLVLSLENGNYYFDAQTMQVTNLDKYDLRAPYNLVRVESGEIVVKLPYYTSPNTMTGVPRTIDFRSEDFKMDSKIKNGVCELTILVRSVKNTYNSAFITPSSSYRMVFTIPLSGTGSTRLNLSPSFTSTITYDGITAL